MTITVMRSSLDFMTRWNFWPRKDTFSKWYTLRFAIFYTCTLVNLVAAILHLIHISIPNKSFAHIAEDLVTISAQVGVYYFLLGFFPHQKKAKDLFERLSSFEKFGKPSEFDQHSKRLENLALANRIGVSFVVFTFAIDPFISKTACEEISQRAGFEDFCGFVTSAWMPFDVQSPLNRFLFVAWQAFSTFWCYEVGATQSFLIVGSQEHVLVNIWHLQGLFEEAVNCEDDQEARTKLKKCIEYHNYIFELAKDVDDVYKTALFVHVLVSGILMGIMGYSVMNVKVSSKTVSLFNIWITGAFVTPVSAQRLSDASVGLGDAVFKTEWYNRNCSFQRDLILVMLRSQSPISIHAGPLATLSHLFIVMILKTAYSYLTLLNATSG